MREASCLLPVSSDLGILGESQLTTVIFCPGPALPEMMFPKKCDSPALGFPSHLRPAAGPVLFGKCECG